MTRPQEALAASVSELTPASPSFDASELGLDESQVFDADAVLERIRATLPADADAQTVRQVSVDVLRDAIQQGRAAIAKAFGDHPKAARTTVRAYSYLTDGIVHCVLNVATRHLHPNPNPTSGERLAILAVGGYGRGEMAPYSDVDLLFLMPWKVTPWAESLIESMLYIFWDLHLKIGHASRSVKDCVRLGKEDYTIRTALLEHRFLDGDRALSDELDRKLTRDLFRNTASEFIEAKLDERAARHKKQGGQRYMVEPKRAKAVCATFRPCSGSGNTSTASRRPSNLCRWGCSAARNTTAFAPPRRS